MSDDSTLDLPEGAKNRDVYARKNGVSTVRLVHAPHDPDAASKWFSSSPASTSGNAVRFLYRGEETFPAMLEALSKTSGAGDFLYLAGWACDLDTQLEGPYSASAREDALTFLTVLREKAAAGVQVRVLLWRNITSARKPLRAFGVTIPAPISNVISKDCVPENEGEVGQINDLPGDVAAILDAHVPTVSAHHQKILVVSAGGELTAFLGGLDIHKSRYGPGGWHDVHCEIKGKAAYDVLAEFSSRWSDHPDRAKAESKPGCAPFLGSCVTAPADLAPGRQTVQIACTYANGASHSFQDGSPGFSFAPTGRQDLFQQILKGIEQARDFVYMDNQYFTSKALARALAKAIPRLQHVTIVLPLVFDVRGGWERTQECLSIIKDAGGDKLRAFGIRFLNRNGDRGSMDPSYRYAHAKAWVFDDQMAIVGTANAGRRSYTSDSEIAAAVVDSGRKDRSSITFAQALRMKLWSALLALPPEELVDGVESAAHWLNPPEASIVVPWSDEAGTLVELWHEYYRSGVVDGLACFEYGANRVTDTVWNNIVDPFAS